MTKEELHQKVDEKVGIELEKLKGQDPYLYNNMDWILEIISQIPIPDISRMNQKSLPYAPIETSLCIAAKFLGECNPEYKERLLKNYRDGVLFFNPKRQARIFYNFYLKRYKILINPKENMLDAMDMIHETLHVTNINKSFYRMSLTETVSIASELLFQEYLEDKGYSKENINLLGEIRRLDFKTCLTHLRWMLPLFISKKNTGRIDEEVFNQLPENAHMSRETIDRNLNVFLRINQTELERYKYALGYIFAKSFFARNPSLEDLSELSEALRKADINKFDDMIFGDWTMDKAISAITKDEVLYPKKPYVKILK